MNKNRFFRYYLASFLTGLVVAAMFLITVLPADAQENPTDGPVYIIQEGDLLWDIAQRFRGLEWMIFQP